MGARGRADPHPRRETNSKYFGQTSTQTRLGRGRGEPQERLCPAAKGAPLSGRDAPELVYRARETVRSNEKGFLRRDASSVRRPTLFTKWAQSSAAVWGGARGSGRAASDLSETRGWAIRAGRRLSPRTSGGHRW